MPSTLIQERSLVISPTLAATIGLEEAVLLQFLYELTQLPGGTGTAQSDWHEIATADLLRLLPFWKLQDCERVAASLRDKGVLLIDSPPLDQSRCLRYNLESHQPVTAAPAAAVPGASARMFGGKTLIAPQWQPDEELMRQLTLHGIPREFALQQVREFILYWSDRGEGAFSWNAKFRSHVIRLWRDRESDPARNDDTPRRIEPDWTPEPDALEILQRGGVNRAFIEDAVPEFVLYWTERGELARTWNSRFVSHVKRQWAKYTQTMELDGEPRRIAANWQPSGDLFDILRMANIDNAFARGIVPEFVMYWSERGEAHPSWNSKFLQHVKYHWARSHQAGASTEQTHGNRQGSGGQGSTRSRPIADDLSDRSWAV